MTTLQRFAIPALCALLIAVAHGHEVQFSGWSTPTNLGTVVNSSAGDFFPAISKDGLSLYFTSGRVIPGMSQGGWDIYVSRRASVDDAWGVPQNLGPAINTPFDEGAPILSADGHRMYFSSTRTGGLGGNDLYVSRRHNKHDDFGWEAPRNLGPEINTAANEANPALFEDGIWGVTTLYFDSNRPGGPGPFTDDPVSHNGNDIYASFLLFDDKFMWAHLVGALSTPFADRAPAIRADGLEIYFSSDRPGGAGLDLWLSTRDKPWHEWGEPVNVPSLNSAVSDAGAALSFDGRTIYFQSTRPGTIGAYDLYAATRTKGEGTGR